jgi:ESS family glutamate:Na+ symporter
MSFLWSLADKNVFPVMGLILPLGFGQGPGQAFSIGNQWEQLGMANGGAIGLAIAAAGFGWATIGGIIILNILLKNKRKKYEHIDIEEKKSIVVKDYEFSDMDGLTIQFVFVGIVYASVYLLLGGMNLLLAKLGTFGESLGTVLWGFHFVFGAILAIVFRRIYNKAHEKGIAKEKYLNNFLLQRIAGFVFDFMVAASISAVTFERIAESFWSIFFITFAGGILTFIYVSFIVRKTMKEHRLANTIAFFGHLTGTISTGMALLREVDPLMKSGAPENMIFGSGVAIFFGFPLMALLSLPPIGLKEGNPMMYLYTFLGLLVYAFFLFGYWYLLSRRRRKKAS